MVVSFEIMFRLFCYFNNVVSTFASKYFSAYLLTICCCYKVMSNACMFTGLGHCLTFYLSMSFYLHSLIGRQ